MSRSLLSKAPKPALPHAVSTHAKDAIFGLSRSAPHVVEVPVDKVRPNPDQPRRVFDEDELQELAASIEKHGLQQPIGVKEIGKDQWELVYGERRLRAMRLLGRETVFGLLVSGDSAEIALIENLQRADLNPVEESDALARLAERHGYSHRDLAAAIGRKKTYVTMALSLQRLAPVIREEYATVRPTKSTLEALAAIEDADEQVRAWEALKNRDITLPSPTADDQDAGRDVDGAGDETPPPKPRSVTSAPAGIALSALPRRAAKPVYVARDVLIGLREQPQRLADVDREALAEMRAAIDAILATENVPAE